VAPELPGCSAFGETEEETLGQIKATMDLWLEVAKKDGVAIPEPQGKDLLNQFYEGVVGATAPEAVKA